MQLTSHLSLIAILALLVAGCGGGGGEVDAPRPAAERERPAAVTPVPAVTGPGEFKSVSHLARVALDEITRAVAAPGSGAPAVLPRYSVDAYRVSYLTLDAQGRQILASGLVALPLKPAGASFPLVSYQHGTIFKDAQAPSNAIAANEPAFVMASLGAIVIAADYVGYGVSKGAPHPYLHAAATASSVLDLLTAVRSQLARYGINENGQLFLVGYSEGGFATMAAHRSMQSSTSGHGVHLVALVGTAPGAGPYNVQSVLDYQLDRVRDENRLIGALITPGLLKRLGSTIRAEVRRLLVKALIPDDADVSFDTRVIDLFLDDNNAGIEALSNVHDWKPLAPVRLFHGRADRTVPYLASTETLTAMQARAAPNVLLTECAGIAPTDHLQCVPPYFQFIVDQMAPVIRDL